MMNTHESCRSGRLRLWRAGAGGGDVCDLSFEEYRGSHGFHGENV